ncbi:fibrinogen-binding protein [Rhizobium sp. BK251]|uniref:fibrinogen-binding protein n=1 Tax=Rhizobium sp. BK251 TaxID=2512125 RepID=UPI00104331CD|nr:fibrinogen-binding protein [Rhizobium sp. BK251]TCL69523.1 hypothetical protein EV286_10895 [Rhizobium sp. BK251]
MSLEIEDNKVGALADGLAASAINGTEIEDDSTGYVGGVANGDDRNNTDIDVKANVDVDADTNINNGDNRDNQYDWSYDSKVDTDIKTTNTTINDNDTTTKTSSDYDWSYDSKVDVDTKTTTISDNDTDIKTISDNDTETKISNDYDANENGDNRDNSYSYHSDVDTDQNWGVVDDVKDFGNLGIAGGDLTFNIGDDFSFNLNVDNVLNGSLSGDGFSIVQAHNIADQDAAYGVRMDNAGATNTLSASGGSAYSDPGVELDGKGFDKGWDLDNGDDVNGSSVADASAILANSGFHLEVVQGANMFSNSVDITVTGGNSHVSDVGDDSGS